MAEEAGFPYWQKRIAEIPDADNLSVTVESAIQAMLTEHEVGEQACADLAGMIIAFIDKKSDLPDKKKRAIKALTPFSLLPKPKKGQASGSVVAAAAAAVVAPSEEEPKPAPETESVPEAKPAPAPEEKKAPAAAQAPAGPGFEKALIKYLAKHIIMRLKPLQLPDKGGEPLPYIYSGKFYKRFADAIEKYIGPEILKNRRIRTLGTTINPDDLSDEIFAYQFSLSEKENTVRTLWLELMSVIESTVRQAQKAKKNKKKGKGSKGEKKGFLAKLGLKKEEAPVGGKTGAPTIQWPIDFWDAITKPAKEDNYSPPLLSEIGLFHIVFDYKIEDITNSIQATAQIMEEEVQSGEPGATRRFLCDRVDKYADHCGELIALWLYFAHHELYSKQIHKSFVSSQGRSDGERKARMPFYTRWAENPMTQDDE
jgi:hypothetical protein